MRSRSSSSSALRQLTEEHAATGVDDDRDAGGSAGSRRELRHLRQQRGRQVVDDEVTEVLERVGGLGPARARRRP